MELRKGVRRRLNPQREVKPAPAAPPPEPKAPAPAPKPSDALRKQLVEAKPKILKAKLRCAACWDGDADDSDLLSLQCDLLDMSLSGPQLRAIRALLPSPPPGSTTASKVNRVSAVLGEMTAG